MPDSCAIESSRGDSGSVVFGNIAGWGVAVIGGDETLGGLEVSSLYGNSTY